MAIELKTSLPGPNSQRLEVRGLGPMQAVELVTDRKSKSPNPDLTKGLVRACYEQGLIVMNAGTYGNVLRLLVPLVADSAELDEGMSVIESSLRRLSVPI